MPLRRVVLDGREYVLIPRKQWESMRHGVTTAPLPTKKTSPSPPDGTYGIQDVRASLAKKMTTRRKAAGLTQAALARMARVRVETISRLENGLHMPGTRTFDRIDRALKRGASRRPAA
jgi:DNA-binding XRE family transcriptional regulator